MPNDAYRAFTEGTPSQSRAASTPSRTGAHCSRLREIAARIPRRGGFRRRTSLNDDRKAPAFQDQNGHSSSSSPSTPPTRGGSVGRELSSDGESAPLCPAQGYLLFVDLSSEDEERHQRTVIIPPENVLLSCPLSPDVTCSPDNIPECSRSPPTSPAGCLNITASSGPICRICHEGDHTESLISLCKCSGTMGLLHASCLQHWLNVRNVDYCELCRHRFPTVAQATCVRRFYHWALYGDSQRALLGDLFCFALLTPVAALSCFLCAHNASKQALEGRIIEAASLVTLAGLLITAYLAWSLLTVRFHYRAFAIWRARNPMRRVLAPGELPRRPEGQPAGPRELVDVVAASVNEAEHTTQHHGGGLRLPSEPSAHALPEEPLSVPQHSVYALEPLTGFSYW